MDGDEVEAVRVGGGQREFALAVVGGRVGEEVVEDGERQPAPALRDAHQHAHHPPHRTYSSLVQEYEYKCSSVHVRVRVKVRMRMKVRTPRYKSNAPEQRKVMLGRTNTDGNSRCYCTVRVRVRV